MRIKNVYHVIHTESQNILPVADGKAFSARVSDFEQATTYQTFM